MSVAGVTFQIASHSAELVRSSHGDLPEEQKSWVCGLKGYEREGCGRIVQASPSLTPASSFESSENGFVQGVVRAYCHHHNLVFRPDDVWLAIAVQFGFYVNANAEALRSLFVSHEGKKELKVCQIASLDTADYGRFSCDMVSQLRRNLKNPNFCDWVLPCFSTTTHNDTIVGSVALMASMKQYFAYTFCLVCGIPQVTLAGTPQDWEEIHSRLDKLCLYGEACCTWASMLKKITSQFIRTSRNDIDLEFWSRICHYSSGGSGPSYLSGWVTAFCVFDGHGKWQATRFNLPHGFTPPHSIISPVLEFPVIETDDIPPGYITVGVTVDDNGVDYKALMFAGHTCFEVVQEGHGIAPKLAWAITLKSELKEPLLMPGLNKYPLSPNTLLRSFQLQ